MAGKNCFPDAHQQLAAPFLCVCTPKQVGEQMESALVWGRTAAARHFSPVHLLKWTKSGQE
jgi:hypothetical protein